MTMSGGNQRPRFAVDLLSKSGHEALVKLNENEIKLLEHMKHYMVKRIKVELEYSAALAKINTSATQAMPDGDPESLIRKVTVLKY